MPVLQSISSFEGTSYKKLQDICTSSFISFRLTSIFTSTDIICYNFSELDSKLSQKKFVMVSLFYWIHPNSDPLNTQNPLRMIKVLC